MPLLFPGWGRIMRKKIIVMAKSSTKFILAGLAGLAAGIAIGVLFAPEKGSKTRKKLKKKMQGIAENLGDEYPENLGFLKSLFRRQEEDPAEEEEGSAGTGNEPVK
jgi:gas vesicle protein